MTPSAAMPATPTFALELEDLADSLLALWLGTALPDGPAVLWAAPRELAITLALGGEREVVLLEPREREAAAAIRHGAPGLRTVHTPVGPSGHDLDGVGVEGARALVLWETAGPVDEALRNLVRAAPDAAVLVVADPARTVELLDLVGQLRGDATVLHHGLSACSHISPVEELTAARVRALGDPVCPTPHQVVVVSGCDAAHLPALVLIGHEQGLRTWSAGVDQMQAAVTAMDEHIDVTRAAEIARLEGAVAEADAGRAAAERSVAEWQRQVEMIHGSTSWRLTRPVRWLKDRTARG